MAKVRGESGRFVSQEAVKKRRGIIVFALSAIAFLCAIWGLFVGLTLHRLNIPVWTDFPVSILVVLVVLGIGKWVIPKLDELEKERLNWERGANGEDLVAHELERFPDDFRIINDLTTPFGNLDHVVVGPTGVFVLETKNWRGIVSADGNGELLCNGKNLDKPYIRQFVRRVMDTKDRVKTLAPGLDPYFQAVFVFTSARVAAKWGTTRSVHCLRDEQLFDYIVESKKGTKLTKQEMEKIAQTFLALAHMDKDFTKRAEPNGNRHNQTVIDHKAVRMNPSTVPATGFSRSPH